MGDDNDEVNEGEDPTGRERVQNALGEDTSSAAVTRFLIKHLPKQLSQLRDEKVQLEDKIHDLELVVSEQRMQMAEHERRVEEALAAAKKMDHQLKKAEEERKVEEKPRAVAEREVSATFRVPVEVTQEEMLLTWTVENREERPCCFWLNYIPPPETHVPFVPLPEEDDNDEVNEGEDPTGRERVQNALGEDTSSAAVTRFLIKHLPKQLSQLRDEKVQLE